MHVEKHEKMCIKSEFSLGLYTFEKRHIKKNGKKSDFKEISFKLATDGQCDKEFLLT